MQITVTYMAQLKQAAGVSEENVDIGDGDSLEKIVAKLADIHGDSFRRILLDSDGALQPAILYFVGDEQIHPGSTRTFRDGESLTVLAPMAGGILMIHSFRD